MMNPWYLQVCIILIFVPMCSWSLIMPEEQAAALLTEYPSTRNYYGRGHFQYPCDVVFSKVHKTGGSTASGVMHSIAYRSGVVEYLKDPEQSQGGLHEHAVMEFKGNVSAILGEDVKFYMSLSTQGHFNPWITHNFPNIFKWTVIRDPVSRWQSAYCFFGPDRCGMNTNGTHIKMKLTGNEVKYQLDTLRGEKTTPRQTLDQFDLVVPFEYFDEGLVALLMLLDLEIGDLLYMRSKVNNKHIEKQRMAFTGFSYSEMEAMILEQGKMNDVLLYDLCVADFQEQLKVLSSDNFNEMLTLFQSHNKNVSKYCDLTRGTGRFEGNMKGRHKDNGCGYRCLEKYAVEQNIMQVNKTKMTPLFGSQELEDFLDGRRETSDQLCRRMFASNTRQGRLKGAFADEARRPKPTGGKQRRPNGPIGRVRSSMGRHHSADWNQGLVPVI